MSKRLILILALAFVVGLTAAAFAEVQNVKVSGDVNAWYMMRDLTLNKAQSDTDKTEGFASIVRVKVDADLTDNVSATVRLLNERYWGTETGNADAGSTNSDVSLDLAYVTLKEFLYSPLTVRIGRQELRFGSALIVGDPDTNNQATTASAFGSTSRDPDLSARKSFDAIRATLDYNPLVIDAIYSEISEGTLTTDDDTTLYGINANYALDKDTTVEAYYFGKHIGREANATNTKTDRVDCVGARLVTVPIENLTYQLEAAYQFGRSALAGRTTTATRRAYAIETNANYVFSNVTYTPSLGLTYGYFTGQKDNDNDHVRAWDPMYEDQTAGRIANALFDLSNVHLAGLSASAKPMEDVTLVFEGYGYWWDKTYGFQQVITDRRGQSVRMRQSNKYAASELDLKAVYDYTEDVQFNLLAAVLIPGDSFDKNNDSSASEVIGSMKVTF